MTTFSKILLHCCCGPCATAVIDFFVEKNTDITAFFFNPNICPKDEHQKRIEAFIKVCDEKNIPYLVEEQPSYINKIVGNSCELCYEFRLKKTADSARKLNLPHFSTTLLVSPFQNHDQIKMVGEKKDGFLYFDLRKLYQSTIDQSKHLGIYRQHYCGCEYSQLVATWTKKRISQCKRVKAGPSQEWIPNWLKK